MSLLARRARPDADARSIAIPATFDEWIESWGSTNRGGTLDHALRNAASWACIDVLADALARTPLDAIRRQGNRRIPIDPVPKVIADPSGIVTADVFRYQLAFAAVTNGNAYARVVATTGAQALPAQLETIDPAAITERDVVAGIPRVRVDGEWLETFPYGPIWHVPGRVVPPGQPWGLSPISYAARVLGTSLSVEDFSNRFFTDGGHPTWAFLMKNDPGPDRAAEFKATITRAMRGNREPLVLGTDIEPKQLQLDPAETQFLDLARFSIEQVCRFWRVPPGMVYGAISGQNVTYANVSQADLAYLKHSLDGYFVRFENAWSRLLPRPQVVKVNRDAILRADPETRARIHDLRLRNATRTINEVRLLEDEEPFGDAAYDTPGLPTPTPGAPSP